MGAFDVLTAYIGAMSTRTTTLKRYHHGDLRLELMRAARAMLREGDIDALSLRELARCLEVSSRAPYRHFATKGALMSALAAEGFRELSAALETAAGDAQPGVRLQGQGRAYVRFALGEPFLFRLMFSYRMSEADPALLAAKQATRALLAESVVAQMAKDDDVEARILGCWSLVHGLAILVLGGLAFEDEPSRHEDRVDRVIDVMLPGF